VIDNADGEVDIRELTNDLCLRTDGRSARKISTRSSSGR